MSKCKTIKTFKEAWTLPFVGDPDGYTSYVWDSKNRMCFNFLSYDEELYKRVIDLLNGKDAVPFKIVQRNDQHILVSDSEENYITPILLVRGWGYLTGCGALKQDNQTAIMLQDQLIDYCVEKLKGNAEQK